MFSCMNAYNANKPTAHMLKWWKIAEGVFFEGIAEMLYANSVTSTSSLNLKPFPPTNALFLFKRSLQSTVFLVWLSQPKCRCIVFFPLNPTQLVLPPIRPTWGMFCQWHPFLSDQRTCMNVLVVLLRTVKFGFSLSLF